MATILPTIDLGLWVQSFFSSSGLWLVLDGCLGVDAFVCLIGW
jgi:hypothetical protein